MEQSRGLSMGPDGKLMLNEYENHAWIQEDVRDRAELFLYDTFTPAGCTLGDLMRLVEKSPLIQLIFHRDFASDIVRETLHGDKDGGTEEKKAEKLDALELRWSGQVDRHGTFYPNYVLDLSGRGAPLEEDNNEHGEEWKKGHVIRWSVSMTPPARLAHLPIVMAQDAIIHSHDHKELLKARTGAPKLGEVLHALFFDLSFYGVGEGRENMREKLDKAMEEVLAEHTLREP